MPWPHFAQKWHWSLCLPSTVFLVHCLGTISLTLESTVACYTSFIDNKLCHPIPNLVAGQINGWQCIMGDSGGSSHLLCPALRSGRPVPITNQFFVSPMLVTNDNWLKCRSIVSLASLSVTILWRLYNVCIFNWMAHSLHFCLFGEKYLNVVVFVLSLMFHGDMNNAAISYLKIWL